MSEYETCLRGSKSHCGIIILTQSIREVVVNKQFQLFNTKATLYVHKGYAFVLLRDERGKAKRVRLS